MEIRFKSRKLQIQYQNSREAEKVYGPEVARKYIQRINIRLANIMMIREDIHSDLDIPPGEYLEEVIAELGYAQK